MSALQLFLTCSLFATAISCASNFEASRADSDSSRGPGAEEARNETTQQAPFTWAAAGRF